LAAVYYHISYFRFNWHQPGKNMERLKSFLSLFQDPILSFNCMFVYALLQIPLDIINCRKKDIPQLYPHADHVFAAPVYSYLRCNGVLLPRFFKKGIQIFAIFGRLLFRDLSAAHALFGIL